MNNIIKNIKFEVTLKTYDIIGEPQIELSTLEVAEHKLLFSFNSLK
jgi:hypothetical protein